MRELTFDRFVPATTLCALFPFFLFLPNTSKHSTYHDHV